MFINYLTNSKHTKEHIAGLLPKESDPHKDPSTNQLIGGNPHRAFVGDPFSESSFGVFNEPIYNFLLSFIPSFPIKNLSDPQNKSGENLKKSLDKKIPVIVWFTIELKEPRETDRWLDEKERENEIVWISPEHCALLVGYDENHFIVNDPHTGNTEYYDKDLFLLRWQQLGCQAVTAEYIP